MSKAPPTGKPASVHSVPAPASAKEMRGMGSSTVVLTGGGGSGAAGGLRCASSRETSSTPLEEMFMWLRYRLKNRAAS